MRKDIHGKCPVRWLVEEDGSKVWICTQLLRSSRYRETTEKCWHYKCPSRSMVGYPYSEEQLVQIKNQRAKEAVVKAEEQMGECANYDCTLKVANTRKKYCSDKCRKQKARTDYEARNPNRKR